MFVNCDFNITVTKVSFGLRMRNAPTGTSVHRNNRERWAVILKTEGKTYYNVGDKTLLSDKYHPLVLSKGCSYSWKCVESGECIIIDFEAPEEYGDIFSFEVSDSSFIVNAFMKIEKKLNMKNAFYQMECTKLLYGILLPLLKSAGKEYVPNHKKDILKPATDYIVNCCCDSKITNEFLAEKCGISTVYFRKMFEKVYGISPISFLNNFRIDKAKSMLCTDFESISQIAEAVGYGSIYHFSKMFKIHTGISPTEYKKSAGGQNDALKYYDG